MPTNTLTDAKCRGAKAGEKLTKHFDGHGLHLAVLPSGAKAWRVAYRLAGRPQTMSLGPYPDVSLADARRKRDELRAVLRDGGDPMAPRRATRAGLTLADACSQYWAGRRDLSTNYLMNATRAMEHHILVRLGTRPIASITRDDIMGVLLPMDAAGHHSYVRKTRMWLGQVFDWSVQRGDAKINPCALIDPRKAFGRTDVTHFAAVSLGELPALMRRLAMEQDLQSALACRLLALTWVRTGELRMMLWTELDGPVWRIPEGKMKRRIEHIVPLSRQALDVLVKLRQRCTGSAYVFPAEHREDRPMSENTVLALLARVGYKGRMTGHGFRSVASTWANETGHRADAVERQLAHVPGDRVRAAYLRTQFLPERTAMLQAWADYLDRCTSDDADAAGAQG